VKKNKETYYDRFKINLRGALLLLYLGAELRLNSLRRHVGFALVDEVERASGL